MLLVLSSSPFLQNFPPAAFRQRFPAVNAAGEGKNDIGFSGTNYDITFSISR